MRTGGAEWAGASESGRVGAAADRQALVLLPPSPLVRDRRASGRRAEEALRRRKQQASEHGKQKKVQTAEELRVRKEKDAIELKESALRAEARRKARGGWAAAAAARDAAYRGGAGVWRCPLTGQA